MVRGAKILTKTLYIIYIGMVLFLCLYKFSSTGIDLGKYFLGIRLDRYVHFLMFLPYPPVTWLTFRFSSRFRFLSRYAIVLTLVSGLIFAGMTELLQSWLTPTRQGDILDFAADSAAIISGTAAVAFAGHPFVRLIDTLFKK